MSTPPSLIPASPLRALAPSRHPLLEPRHALSRAVARPRRGLALCCAAPHHLGRHLAPRRALSRLVARLRRALVHRQLYCTPPCPRDPLVTLSRLATSPHRALAPHHDLDPRAAVSRRLAAPAMLALAASPLSVPPTLSPLYPPPPAVSCRAGPSNGAGSMLSRHPSRCVAARTPRRHAPCPSNNAGGKPSHCPTLQVTASAPRRYAAGPSNGAGGVPSRSPNCHIAACAPRRCPSPSRRLRALSRPLHAAPHALSGAAPSSCPIPVFIM
ncbi:hypothetical protein DENSPDRAFT_886740 [Dentipellis sp. KUC8613]|nr:hypothetical protein DENSPDRAFT_886740 [Dentipellis sp. KUC8613]